MNKTIIYALLQTIKRFLFSIFKHRIPIEKYLFQNYLSIQTFWQIGLHRAVPLRTFSRGHSVDVSVQSLKQLCSKLPQWDSSGSGLISVIHAFWVSEREMLALIAAFRQLIACSTMFGKGLWGGSILSSCLGREWPGFGGPVLRHTQRSPPRRDLDLSSPVPGSYRNAQHWFC